MNRIQAMIRATIEKHGFMVQGVFPTEDNPSPYFAYSIGLRDKYGFDLILVGLPLPMAGAIINDVAALLDNGIALNVPVEGILMVPLMFKDCAPELVKDYAVQAEVYYGGPTRFIQILWPDTNSKFPSDPQFDSAKYGEMQRLLYTIN